MLTCTDDDIDWVTDRCCMCGSRNDVVHCGLCGHDFCAECKGRYYYRGIEAVKALLGSSTLVCGGVRHG